MKFLLPTEIKVLHDKAVNDLFFLFNLHRGSWVAISSPAFKYLEELVALGEDPLSLGIHMGFSQEEIEQFLGYMIDREILTTTDQYKEATPAGLQTCYLHVTQVCNLRCRTCYNWRENRNYRQGELSLEQMDQVLAQLKSLGLQTLVISGGEPFMRKDLPQILRLARDKHQISNVVLITNGTLITSERAEAIAPWVDEVAVSLDGPTEEVNAIVRGEGTFERALQGLKVLKSSSVKTVKMLPTLHHRNKQYLKEFSNLADELGVAISFSMFIGTGAGGESEAAELLLTAEDFRYLARTMIEMGNIQINMDGGFAEQSDQETDTQPLEMLLEAKAGCGVGYKLLAIDYDGGVYPCHMLMSPELRMGTIPNKPLAEILQDSSLAQFFRHLNVDQVAICQSCSMRYFCGGGCRANAYSIHGNFNAHDPACELTHTFTQLALGPLLRQAA